MVLVTFKYGSGAARSIDVPVGQSVMEAAVRLGIDGIDADCGGALSCATCHVWVDPGWLSLLTDRSRQETSLLEFAIGVQENSRLCCQILAGPQLEGLIVEVPPAQK
ncbi:MAG: 2Fe-2S iron-sulfur cluster-binding protein [Bradyrhizobium sp.]